MEAKDEFRYVGSETQLFSVKEYRLAGGKQEGVRCVDVSNGGRLDFTIVADRCMDFYQVKFNGVNCSYLSPAGVVAPQYYDRRDSGWLESFAGGFLTTCGLSNIGVPSVCDGQQLYMHGSISNIPAERVNIERSAAGGEPAVKISGSMTDASLFGTNLTLTRTISCKYGTNKIEFTDEVRNNGYKPAPLMLLYHFNIGYPLLDEYSRLDIDSLDITPRDKHAEKHIADWRVTAPPADDFAEMCYYHDIAADTDGRAAVGISNASRKIRVKIEYNKTVLDNFVQWKMLGAGEYVMGLEPCNSSIEGRTHAREQGALKYIEPQSVIRYPFTISFSSE